MNKKRGCLISTRQPLFIQIPIGEGKSFKQISGPFFNYEIASFLKSSLVFQCLHHNTDWTNNIVQYRLSPHCTICLIPSALTPESIRDKIYKILAYYINHIGITIAEKIKNFGLFINVSNKKYTNLTIRHLTKLTSNSC